jgi:glycosyltransferase involved in cell wall biosynthesis
MKILIVSDAWTPQVNGVVRTLAAVRSELSDLGHAIAMLTPDLFATVPCPGYAEIRLALATPSAIGRRIEEAGAEAIHIATEGPLGVAARRHCLRRGYAFTTAYHTRFPEYLSGRYAVPEALTYALLRRFHGPSSGVMVATQSVRRELTARGFANLLPWSRGVDTRLFDAAKRDAFIGLPRPIFLSVGRIAHEKNLPEFLALDLPGSKVAIGEGPSLQALRRRFPDAHFLGRRDNGNLARLYASADVFVFPSRTDTFGLVLLEALASGLPIAAYPVPGPLDIVADSGVGVLSEDLGHAALAALAISRERCREHALRYSWTSCARQFLANLVPTRGATVDADRAVRAAGRG